MNEEFKKLIDSSDTIVIGAGAGLSSASGFEYGNKTFMDNFKYMHDKYSIHNIHNIHT